MSQSKIILASASPRRRQLLGLLGVDFSVMPADVDEDPWPGETPLETQHRITRDKARAVAARLETAASVENSDPKGSNLILACDTTVLLDGEMLNKPADASEARWMLRQLRGRAHEVQSAIVVRAGGDEIIDIVTSEVLMRAYGDDEIEAYIASGDPYDKAGGYAVQHTVFRPVAEIRGCPLNVIGLALCQLRARLPWLPDSAPACVAVCGRACPARLGDRAHAVSGQALRVG